MFTKLKQDQSVTLSCKYLHIKMVEVTTAHSKVYDGHDTCQVSQLTFEEIPIFINYELIILFSLMQQSETWSITSSYEFRIFKAFLKIISAGITWL